MRRTGRGKKKLGRATKKMPLRKNARISQSDLLSLEGGSRPRSSSLKRRTRAVRPSSKNLDVFNERIPLVSGPVNITGSSHNLSPEDLDALVDENRLLKQLHQIINFLGGFTDVDELLPEIIDLGTKITGLGRATLATIEGHKGEACQIRTMRGWKRSEQNSENFKLARRMITLAATDKRPYFITDFTNQRSQPRGQTIKTIIALPMQTHDELLGVLVFADERERDEYSRSERELLTNFARHAGLILARLTNESDTRKRKDHLERSHRALKNRLDEACQRIRELKGDSPIGDGTLASAKNRFYKDYLRSVLKRNRGSFTAASNEAGISRDEFCKLVQKYDAVPSASSESRKRRKTRKLED